MAVHISQRHQMNRECGSPYSTLLNTLVTHTLAKHAHTPVSQTRFSQTRSHTQTVIALSCSHSFIFNVCTGCSSPLFEVVFYLCTGCPSPLPHFLPVYWLSQPTESPIITFSFPWLWTTPLDALCSSMVTCFTPRTAPAL